MYSHRCCHTHNNLCHAQYTIEAAHSSRLTGHVSAGIFPSIAAVVGVPFTILMLERHTDIKIHLVESLSGNLSHLINSRQLVYACNSDAPISCDALGLKSFPILLMEPITLSAIYLTIRPAIRFEPVELGWIKHLLGKLFHGKTIPTLITGVLLSISTYYLFDRVLDVPLSLRFFS